MGWLCESLWRMVGPGWQGRAPVAVHLSELYT